MIREFIASGGNVPYTTVPTEIYPAEGYAAPRENTNGALRGEFFRENHVFFP
jgi:hypothetical protein